MEKDDKVLDRIAIQAFRDMADKDYISARLSYKARLMPQFFWSGLQSIEKYIKCILLLNRVSSKNISHNIIKGIEKVCEITTINAQISENSKNFSILLHEYGKDRYLCTGYDSNSDQLVYLDLLVHEVRRYCLKNTNEIIEANGSFVIENGYLENVLNDNTDPARTGLIWNNMYFYKKRRRRIALSDFELCERSELVYSPELVTKLNQYIYLPKEAMEKYLQASQ